MGQYEFTPEEEEAAMAAMPDGWGVAVRGVDGQDRRAAPPPSYEGAGEPPPGSEWGGPHWLPRDIFAPVSEAERAAVRHAQRALRVAETGEMDPATMTALRGMQSLFKLPVSGLLDSPTAYALDGIRNHQEG